MENFNLNNNFDEIDKALSATSFEGSNADTAKLDEDKAERKAKEADVKRKYTEALNKTIEEDPDFEKKLFTFSDKIEVVKTLGYGDKGNMIFKSDGVKGADGKLRRNKDTLVQVPAIVGYRLKNISDTPVSYETELYSADENGVWVGSKQTLEAQPGEEFCLTRKYMSILGCRAEFSLKFANGSMKRSSAKIAKGDIDALLESLYFIFDDKNVKVNDDEVKEAIANREGDNKWVIKPEFEGVFGFLNNEKPKKEAKKSGSKNSKYSSPVMLANMLNRQIRGKGNA